MDIKNACKSKDLYEVKRVLDRYKDYDKDFMIAAIDASYKSKFILDMLFEYFSACESCMIFDYRNYTHDVIIHNLKCGDSIDREVINNYAIYNFNIGDIDIFTFVTGGSIKKISLSLVLSNFSDERIQELLNISYNKKYYESVDNYIIEIMYSNFEFAKKLYENYYNKNLLKDTTVEFLMAGYFSINYDFENEKFADISHIIFRKIICTYGFGEKEYNLLNFLESKGFSMTPTMKLQIDRSRANYIKPKYIDEISKHGVFLPEVIVYKINAYF